jgi:hypothetical protein
MFKSINEFTHHLEKKYILESKLGSFSYELPKQKDQQLFDFYMLSFLTNPIDPTKVKKNPDEDLQFELDTAQKTLLTSLRKEMLLATLFAVTAELYHIKYFEPTSSISQDTRLKSQKNILDQIRRKMKLDEENTQLLFNYLSILENEPKPKHKMQGIESKIKGADSDEPYKQIHDTRYMTRYKYAHDAIQASNSTPKKFVELASLLFENKYIRWEGSYGGKNWKAIADGWLRLANAQSIGDQIVAIDHIYDLQHNTGSVFDKIKNYYKKTSGFWDLDWLAEALDYKAKIKSPYEIWDKVSPNMRTLAGFVLKDVYDTTWEQFQNKQKDNKSLVGKKVDMKKILTPKTIKTLKWLNMNKGVVEMDVVTGNLYLSLPVYNAPLVIKKGVVVRTPSRNELKPDEIPEELILKIINSAYKLNQ